MHRRAKNAFVVVAGLVLAVLGVYNIVLKATWTVMDDGVLWRSSPQGLIAARIAPDGPAARAGIQADDVLVAIDGDEVLSPGRLEQILVGHRSGDRLTYSLLRLRERRALDVRLQPVPQGNVSAFYYLSLVGFFSLVVGTVVALRRPADRTALHFYAVCVLFFLAYSTSFAGKLDAIDWTFVWTDHLAVLFLPVVYLHFCLTFPERRLRAQRSWIVPALYMPALVVTGASVMSHALVAFGGEPRAIWKIVEAVDRVKPLYFAAGFALSFAVLMRSYQRTRSLVARRQVKWLLWGTATGAFPFLAFYALPFALRAGREPALALQLLGYGPLAVDPALARLRGRQASADGRRAALPPWHRLRAGARGDPRLLAADGGRHGQAVGGAARDGDRSPERARGGVAVHARQGLDPGGARPALLQGALLVAPGAGAALRGPQRRPRPRAHLRAAAGGDRRGPGPARDGDLPAWRRRRDDVRSAPAACRASARACASQRARCWTGSRRAWPSTSSPLPRSTRSSPPTGSPGSSRAA